MIVGVPVSAASDVFGFLIPNFYPYCFKFFRIYSFKSFKVALMYTSKIPWSFWMSRSERFLATPPLEVKVPVTIGSANGCIDTLALKFSLNFWEVSLMQMALYSHFIIARRTCKSSKWGSSPSTWVWKMLKALIFGEVTSVVFTINSIS